MCSKIKGLYLVVLLASALETLSAQDTTSLRFTYYYQGRNLYVQNPFYDDSTFCTCQVNINQQKKYGYIASSSYEIDLSAYQLNDTLDIQIFHYKSCKPKLLNPYTGHRRLNVFKSVTNWGKTIVCVCNEGVYEGVFYVEHFEYNSWVNKEEAHLVKGDSMFTANVNPFSGVNKYRLKYVAPNGEVCYSQIKEIDFEVKKPKVTIDLEAEMIYFSERAEFHVLDERGICLLEGFEKELNISSLHSAVFYLQVDNKTTKFKVNAK